MPRTVLIVDDDPAFRRVAARLLTARGLRVVAVASGGVAALEAASRLRPDCVLLDMQLDGEEGTAVARALTGGPGPPVVVLTSADATGPSARTMVGCRARGFVPKDRLAEVNLAALFRPADT